MEALGLKARSNIQTYDGMRRSDSVLFAVFFSVI